jgi:subtilisin family serine protease
MLHLDLRPLVGSLLLLSPLGLPRPAAAEAWRSPLHEKTYIQIEKRLDGSAGLDGTAAFAPLPGDLVARLGGDLVEYESFVAVYLAAAEAASMAEDLTAGDWRFQLGIDRRVELPWHSFEAGDTKERTADFAATGLTARPLPELYLLQFAYPVLEKWLDEVEGCGLNRLATLQQRTVLVRARGLAEILGCPAARYLSWIDSYRSTDRVPPAMLAEEAPLGYTLHFAPGTDLGAKAERLPGGARALGLAPAQHGALPALQLQASRSELQTLVADDPDLLSVTHRGILDLSDERQGQIVAGNYNANGTVTTPGYRAWLNSRGLLTDTNQQVVGLVDSGYENGLAAMGNHNPDLLNPRRLVAPLKLMPNDDGADRLGHGTMVAGIIAGEGTLPFGAGGRDPEGFHYGSGISPRSRLVAAQLQPGMSVNTTQTLALLKDSVAYCRTDPGTGTDRAFIVNNSYNSHRADPNGIRLAVNEYDDAAKMFDSLVLDGDPQRSGFQSTSLIFSAGNYAYNYQTRSVRFDSVASPATAKNVISIGATSSYRPAPIPPLPCQENPNGSRPPDQDAVNIADMGLFSGLGSSFQAAPHPTRLHQRRIKPDLVAPGVRVFSTVPFNPAKYVTPVGCMKYYPEPTEVYHHTYGTGTSFSAPVVSGAAALARKFFLDRGIAPSPSLLKAALIATADDLPGTDHRPSPRFGWGRVSLKRLTEPGVNFFHVNESAPVATGELRSWIRQVGDPAKDVYIVLVWSDQPSDLPGSSQVPLKNDLSLTLQLNGTKFPFWGGNNFLENKTGSDTGYSYRFQSVSDPLLVDSINNVEAIFLPAHTFAAGQALTLRVRGENVTQGPQSFSVYAWNVKPNP